KEGRLEEIIQKTLTFAEADVARFIYGSRDAHLRILEATFEVEIGARGNNATISGSPPDVKITATVLNQLYALGKKGFAIAESDVRRAIQVRSENPEVSLVSIFSDVVFVSASQKSIAPKGLNQKRYVDAIRHNDIVFGI